jgi:hypothetical protein
MKTIDRDLLLKLVEDGKSPGVLPAAGMGKKFFFLCGIARMDGRSDFASSGLIDYKRGDIRRPPALFINQMSQLPLAREQ